MAEITIVYWRDIPAQVMAGKGRRATKVALPERFEQAIDRAAMKSGASETDAYLADWRKGEPFEVAGEADAAVAQVSAQIDTEYDTARLASLIGNDGRA